MHRIGQLSLSTVIGFRVPSYILLTWQAVTPDIITGRWQTMNIDSKFVDDATLSVRCGTQCCVIAL